MSVLGSSTLRISPRTTARDGWPAVIRGRPWGRFRVGKRHHPLLPGVSLTAPPARVSRNPLAALRFARILSNRTLRLWAESGAGSDPPPMDGSTAPESGLMLGLSSGVRGRSQPAPAARVIPAGRLRTRLRGGYGAPELRAPHVMCPVRGEESVYIRILTVHSKGVYTPSSGGNVTDETTTSVMSSTCVSPGAPYDPHSEGGKASRGAGARQSPGPPGRSTPSSDWSCAPGRATTWSTCAPATSPCSRTRSTRSSYRALNRRALATIAWLSSSGLLGRGARWEEMDIEAREWRIPAQRMKTGREHRGSTLRGITGRAARGAWSHGRLRAGSPRRRAGRFPSWRYPRWSGISGSVRAARVPVELP